ncbi:MAG: hypothetical protein ISS36_02805 [Candidatus Aenigmarchaeota archaeon]|nr:hypothetical protein [Candidatus Aenigmarchaeota archaeon]
MSNIIKLESIKDKENSGIKALNLKKLISNGLPVPAGFVITTNAFKKFLSANRLDNKIGELLGKSVGSNLYDIYKEIEELILDAQIPDSLYNEIKNAYEELSVGKEVKELGGLALDLVKAGRNQAFVAVRSSPTNEDLKQMNAILSAQGMGQLGKSIKRCWAGLFSPRAIINSKNKGYQNFPLIAVIVQKMVNAEKSGILYTSNPDNGNAEQMVIEAMWGIGSSVSAGFIIPDEYILNKNTGKVINKRIRKKLWSIEIDGGTGKLIKRRIPNERINIQVMSDSELKTIFEIAESIGSESQEIEWGIERNRVHIIQARKENILEEIQAEEIPGKLLLDGIPVSNGKIKGKAKIVLSSADFDKVEEGDIIVTDSVRMEMDELLSRAIGIVTDHGGRRCRASIIANEKNIPCIVGTENATTTLKDGQQVVLMNGKVYKLESVSEYMQPETESFHEPQGIHDGVIATNVKLSLTFPEVDEEIINKCDGIGILKSESFLTNHGKHPILFARESSEDVIDKIVSNVGRVAKMFYPKTVWYKLLDMKTNELKGLEFGEEEDLEDNSLLGWHGIRRSLDQQDLLRCEMEAIEKLNQQGITNIGVLVPFASTIDEFRMFKEMYPSVGRIKTGLVVGTPSSGLEVESFCKEGVSYVLIDIDVLTQLVLGVDRNNKKITRLYSETSPAVLNIVRQIVQKCKKHGIETCIAGDSCSDPQTAEKFVEVGIGSISTDVESIDRIKAAIARTEKKLLLDNVRGRQEEYRPAVQSSDPSSKVSGYPSNADL